MNTFSGSTNLWRLLGEHKPLDVLHWWSEGLLSRLRGKIGQNDQIYDFWAHAVHFQIFFIFIHKSKKWFQFLIVLMRNFWRIWALRCLHWWCEGLLSGLGGGAKIVKNGQKYELWVHFAHFHFKELRNEYSFW